ncbi:MAG: hypothetical protein JHC93_06130 [Parachlamydiales bacterium]|nr:hypothetical protein [Parachlamydiales bacterium]
MKRKPVKPVKSKKVESDQKKPLSANELKKLAAAGELTNTNRTLPYPIEPFHP